MNSDQPGPKSGQDSETESEATSTGQGKPAQMPPMSHLPEPNMQHLQVERSISNDESVQSQSQSQVSGSQSHSQSQSQSHSSSAIPQNVINTVMPNSLRNAGNLQHQSVFLDVVDAFQTYIGDKLQMVEEEMAQQEDEIKALQDRLGDLTSGHQEQEIYIFQVIRNASAQLQAKQSVLSQSLRRSRDGKISQLKSRVL